MMLISCLITIPFIVIFTVSSVIWYDLNDDFTLSKWCSWLELIMGLLLVVVVSLINDIVFFHDLGIYVCSSFHHICYKNVSNMLV